MRGTGVRPEACRKTAARACRFRLGPWRLQWEAAVAAHAVRCRPVPAGGSAAPHARVHASAESWPESVPAAPTARRGNSGNPPRCSLRAWPASPFRRLPVAQRGMGIPLLLPAPRAPVRTALRRGRVRARSRPAWQGRASATGTARGGRGRASLHKIIHGAGSSEPVLKCPTQHAGRYSVDVRGGCAALRRGEEACGWLPATAVVGSRGAVGSPEWWRRPRATSQDKARAERAKQQAGQDTRPC